MMFQVLAPYRWWLCPPGTHRLEEAYDEQGGYHPPVCDKGRESHERIKPRLARGTTRDSHL